LSVHPCVLTSQVSGYLSFDSCFPNCVYIFEEPFILKIMYISFMITKIREFFNGVSGENGKNVIKYFCLQQQTYIILSRQEF